MTVLSNLKTSNMNRNTFMLLLTFALYTCVQGISTSGARRSERHDSGGQQQQPSNLGQSGHPRNGTMSGNRPPANNTDHMNKNQTLKGHKNTMGNNTLDHKCKDKCTGDKAVRIAIVIGACAMVIILITVAVIWIYLRKKNRGFQFEVMNDTYPRFTPGHATYDVYPTK